MNHVQGTFKGFDNLSLYFQSWYPRGYTQAIVVMLHGLGSHSDEFSPAVEYLVAQGYEVHAFDLRGHGRSPGQRGYINAWIEFREDVHAFLKHIYSQRSSCPCFLWGHSLGGTIALDYALRQPNYLHGVIVSAPALEKVRVSPIKLTLGRLLSRVMPRFSLELGIRNELGSRNAAIRAIYLQDPLRHSYGSARLATEFFATVKWINKHTADLQIPLLVLHGGADQVTFPEDSRAFFEKIIFPDKEHHEYPGYYHDLYVDVNYQAILIDMNKWLERHLEGTSCSPALYSALS